MPISKIRPRGDIKTNWETVNPILQLREIGVEWESTIGEGDAKIKFGDGLTHWNDLDYAIVNNITKKIVTALAVVEEEDPELNDGEAVDTLFGKIKKKFQTIQSKIAAINTIIGVFEDITIDTGGDSEQAAENITTAINLLNTGKLTTSDIYNGLDSTNTALALSALQGKNLNDAITSLNSDMNLVFQARSDLSVDASNLTWMQSGIYRVRGDNPVNGITDGFLVHFTPYKNNDAWFQILIDFSGLKIYLRCKWYTTIRDWLQIEVIS